MIDFTIISHYSIILILILILFDIDNLDQKDIIYLQQGANLHGHHDLPKLIWVCAAIRSCHGILNSYNWVFICWQNQRKDIHLIIHEKKLWVRTPAGNRHLNKGWRIS